MRKGARREENVMSTKTAVDLFTPEEHRILSEWLEIEPQTAPRLPAIDEALERLGFEEETGEVYTNVQAAVAFIVLEAVEKRLPQWVSVADGEVNFARDYRPKELVPARRAAMLPQYLFTLNWADSGPGFNNSLSPNAQEKSVESTSYPIMTKHSNPRSRRPVIVI
jgi:hypothetical protein